MTLLRQLIIVIVTIFILLFMGIFAINVHNTRDFLNSQLETVSQDTATSLGLTLSPHMIEEDAVVVESLASAVFDSGYYQEVLVLDMNNKPLVDLKQPVPPAQAPAWFVKLFPLETPVGKAMIMSGWQQAGSIQIRANPGMAYANLWDSSVESFYCFLAASVLAVGLGMLAMYYLLKPLRAVENQAIAVSNREYPIQAKLPWTRELRRVVEAMNLMSAKVREMFSEQNATIDRLRNDTYRDALTELANRTYFEMQLRHLLNSEAEFGNGALIFLEVCHIEQINQQAGYKAGNALLVGVGRLIQSKLNQFAIVNGFVARLSGPGFAVVISDVPNKIARDFSSNLANSLLDLHKNGLTQFTEIGHVGLAMYRGQSFSQFLSEADRALRTAQLVGVNAFYQHEQAESALLIERTATEWTALLRHALDKRLFVFYHQPVKSLGEPSVTTQYEVLLRIRMPDGEIMPAGVFVPMVHRLGMGQEFDRVVVDEVIARLKENKRAIVAINLMPESLGNAEFVEWMFEKLDANRPQASRICLEVSEYAVSKELPAMQALIKRIAPTGAKFGIDRFGKGFGSTEYLHALRIEYIKIDGSFIRGIDDSLENQYYVESLVNLARMHDIRVIAESVETAAEMEKVHALRVDAVQGYGVKRPEEWKVENNT